MDHALVTLRFENGIIAHLEGSWAQPEGTPFATSFEIAGTKGLYQYSKKAIHTPAGSNGQRREPGPKCAGEPLSPRPLHGAA
ncbi:MAG: Gfo/Idh/MocA family protein [Limnochordia bacterium]